LKREKAAHTLGRLCAVSENKQVFYSNLKTNKFFCSKFENNQVILHQFEHKQVFLQQFEHKQARNRTKIFESLALNFTENRQTQLTWPRLAFLVISCSLRINKHRITTVCTFSLRFEGKKCPTFNKKTSLYSFIFLAVTSPA